MSFMNKYYMHICTKLNQLCWTADVVCSIHKTNFCKCLLVLKRLCLGVSRLSGRLTMCVRYTHHVCQVDSPCLGAHWRTWPLCTGAGRPRHLCPRCWWSQWHTASHPNASSDTTPVTKAYIFTYSHVTNTKLNNDDESNDAKQWQRPNIDTLLHSQNTAQMYFGDNNATAI